MSTYTQIDATIDEKRRWHRYSLSVPVRVTLENPQHTTLTDTLAHQINEGGIAISADAELSIGTQVLVEFMPPWFDFPLNLRGVIRNRAGGQYGMEFLVTTAAEKEHLIILGEILRSQVHCFDA